MHSVLDLFRRFSVKHSEAIREVSVPRDVFDTDFLIIAVGSHDVIGPQIGNSDPLCGSWNDSQVLEPKCQLRVDHLVPIHYKRGYVASSQGRSVDLRTPPELGPPIAADSACCLP
jgi:hypothetical protein